MWGSTQIWKWESLSLQRPWTGYLITLSRDVLTTIFTTSDACNAVVWGLKHGGPQKVSQVVDGLLYLRNSCKWTTDGATFSTTAEMKLYLFLSQPALLVPVKKCSILGGSGNPCSLMVSGVWSQTSQSLPCPSLHFPSPSCLRSPPRVYLFIPCSPVRIRLEGTRPIIPVGKKNFF